MGRASFSSWDIGVVASFVPEMLVLMSSKLGLGFFPML